MAVRSLEQVLVPVTTSTSSSTSTDIVLPEQFTAVILWLDATAVSGTSPTLNVYVQDAITGAAAGDAAQAQATGTVVYDDYAALTQVTAVSKQKLRIVGGGGQGTSQPTAASDGALTAGTVRNGPIGRKWRIKWTIAGTSPSFTWSLVAQFIP